MYIYINNKNTLSSHILDPDYTYHTSIFQDDLYDFYKNIQKPENIQKITGIYMQYQIIPFPFEKEPLAYENFHPLLVKMIHHFLDFSFANLYCHHTNAFYLVMFDTDQDQLCQSLLNLSKFLKQLKHTYHHRECVFKIQYGVYIAHKYISPFHLFQASQEQYENTVIHDSLISVK